MQANIPHHFSATVVFTETGYYTVSAVARQKVDDGIHQGTQDTIYLKIDINQGIFEQKPSKETPENLPTPPAIEILR